MPKKMSRRLVAQSSSAVAAAYFAGLLTTEAAGALQTGTPSPAAAGVRVPAALDTRPAPAPAPGSPGAAAALPAAADSSAAGATASGYRDGTYTGSGMSRRGGVDVSVVIQGGRIAGVTITGGSTQYPLSRIAALPGEVVARQSAEVDRVTGATYSMQAFRQAVQQALAQAQAGGGTSVLSGLPAAPAAPSTQPAPAQPPGTGIQPGVPRPPDRTRRSGDRSRF